ncbi:hypothetical protein E2C01_047407 [Portunus trituberculatus]|uniref:Uncharacterized protein n=1 Tax=Portunus trituberculatus TaxID=210409 RepID=A0A5B7G8G3_PORTR|nr:hypothetical protein [Portunus trituberculatus]
MKSFEIYEGKNPPCHVSQPLKKNGTLPGLPNAAPGYPENDQPSITSISTTTTTTTAATTTTTITITNTTPTISHPREDF